MKNKDDSRSCAHIFFVTAQGEQCIRGTGKHKVIKQLLIFKNKVIQFMWNRKNGMVIGASFDQLRVSRHDPFLFLGRLTAGTVPVITGTGMKFNMSAYFAEADVIPKRAGLAFRDTSGSF